MLKGLTNNTPLNLFYDVYFSPLSVYDLSLIVENIIKKPIFGLYHCASNDSISKYDFGKEMAKIFNLPSLNINKVSVNSADFKAKRPKNMTLNIEKISLALEYDFPSAIDAIKSMKRQYNNENH
jgi:dTDP-4-dehydrorhamnose reductase